MKVEELDAALNELMEDHGLTLSEAIHHITAFKEHEQEDEDKPWAKPT